MPKMPRKWIKSREAQNATKLKKGTEAIQTKIARNAKGLLKPEIPKYQKSQKVKKAKVPTITHKLKKNPEKPKMPKRRKKRRKLKKPKKKQTF